MAWAGEMWEEGGVGGGGLKGCCCFKGSGEGVVGVGLELEGLKKGRCCFKRAWLKEGAVS